MNKVIVTINGVNYPMVGEKTEQKMKQIANYVDEEMAYIIDANQKLSLSDASVLTAINITDKLFECSEENQRLEQENKSLTKKIGTPDEGLKLEIKKLKLELDAKVAKESEKDALIKELTEQLEARNKELEDIGSSTEGMKAELEGSKSQMEELTIKAEQAEERAKIAESLSSEFQNKAYKLQLNYTELENELKYLRAMG